MMDVTLFACLLGAGRILIGLASLFAIDRVGRWFGLPEEHFTPTMRLFARLFGNRDLGLGVLVFAALGELPLLRLALLFNAAHDVLDACAIAVPLIRSQGIRRPALAFLSCAISGVVLFLSTWWWTFS
jgi:hypothetical protein